MVHAQAVLHGRLSQVSSKHLRRYVTTFAGLRNIRDFGTANQMRYTVRAMRTEGKLSMN